MRRRLVLALAVALLASFFASPTVAQEGIGTVPGTGCGIARAAGTRAHTVRAAGLTRTYHLTVPPGYHADQRVPIVVDMHGAASNAQQEMLLTRARAEAAARGWVVATPDAGRVLWYLQARGGEDVTFIQRVVQDAARRLCIHPNRRFAMGMSNGAAMAATLPCALPTTFAAVGPVAGVNIAGVCPERPTPILAVHGTSDPTVPYQGGQLGGRAPGFNVPPVETRMREWALRNHCDLTPTRTLLVDQVTEIAYPGCDEPVVLLRVSRGGHTWPGGPTLPPRFGPTNQTLDATEAIFDFFEATFT